MNKLDPFEELLRSKLQSNELKFDNSLWNSIEKELPKSSIKSKTYKYIGLSIVAIGITASIIYYNSVNKIDNNNVLVDEVGTFIENKKEPIEDKVINEEVAILNTTNNDNVNINNSNENLVEIKLVSESNNAPNNNIELETNAPITEIVDNVKEDEIMVTENTEENFVISDTAVPSLSITCNKTEICLGEELILNVNSDADFAYLWDFGDGKDDINESKHIYSNIGEYKVKLKTSLKNNHDKYSFSNEITVTVNESPSADFIYKLRETNGMSVIDFEYITNDLPNVNWNFDDGSNSTEYKPSHRYNQKGTYLCSLTVSNIFGCSNTSEQTIFIYNSFQLLAPNSFTPNGDGINDYFIPEALKVMTVDFIMTIFDKNGNKVYETKNVNQGWNGFNYYSSEKCQQDSYVWLVKLVNNEGEKEEYKGAILLLK
jgi:gliding motility-associated-like protein